MDFQFYYIMDGYMPLRSTCFAQMCYSLSLFHSNELKAANNKLLIQSLVKII